MFEEQTSMSDENDFEVFQEVLVELLTSGMTYDVILERLKSDVRLADYQEYIRGFDPDMIAVASEITIKWARRKSELASESRTE